MRTRSTRWMAVLGVLLAAVGGPFCRAASAAAISRSPLDTPRAVINMAFGSVWAATSMRMGYPSFGFRNGPSVSEGPGEDLRKQLAAAPKETQGGGEEHEAEGLMRMYQRLGKTVGHMLTILKLDKVALWRLGLVIVVVLASAWRLLASWRNEQLSGIVTLILICGLLALEKAVIVILPGFSTGEFLFVLGALAGPIGVWIVVGAVNRLHPPTARPRRSEWHGLMRIMRERTAAERRGRGPRGRT